MEIAIALRREPKIRVIPVLVEEAGLPRAEELPDALVPLTRHQAVELSEKRW